jgi:hypothetical protein
VSAGAFRRSFCFFWVFLGASTYRESEGALNGKDRSFKPFLVLSQWNLGPWHPDEGGVFWWSVTSIRKLRASKNEKHRRMLDVEHSNGV